MATRVHRRFRRVVVVGRRSCRLYLSSGARHGSAVARLALDTIAGKGDYLPPDLNAHIPKTWLFLHRWEDGGRCPKTKKLLHREEVGGRTTCWSPARQKLRPA